MRKKSPEIVRIHDVEIDSDYVQWINEIKDRYRSSQIKAAVRVNAEQLLFNWQLGKDLVIRKAEEKWGAGIVEQLSLDLQAAFPESKGFGVTNLWYMKRWYLFYADTFKSQKLQQAVEVFQTNDILSEIKLHQLGEEFQQTEIQSNIKLHQLGGEFQKTGIQANKKLQQVVGGLNNSDSIQQTEVELPDIFTYVPWRHHIEIITKSKTVEEAFFYIEHCASEGWSRQTLMNCIKSDYFHKSGKAITNFSEHLPESQSRLAQAITKDIYDFGFVSLPKEYEEEQLETELEQHLTRFLLELGTGFAYLGRQKQIVVAGKTRKLDMLFFHIPLNCYIVVELKVVPFQPEFVGKLNFYVNAVDELIKTPAQNSTIGLLICSNKEETEVQYAFKGLQTPLGVASYENIQVKKLQEQLPSIEELKKRIRLLEKELNK